MKITRMSVLLSLAMLFQAASATSAFADTFTWDNALKLFDPADAPPANTENGLGDWKDCIVKDKGYQAIAADADGNLLPGCQPDTLYSWGPYLKLLDFIKDAPGHDGPWTSQFAEMIYTHINPLATFGYGELSIRMKLRKSTKFLLYTADAISTTGNAYCTQLLKPEQLDNTVIVRYWHHGEMFGTDYMLCSAGPIESWSYGTKRHYDELAASQTWNNNLKTGSNDWISYTVNGSGNMLYGTGLDGFDWSTAQALKNFETMYDAASENLGKIYYAPDVTPDETEHFTSNHKVYWHWNNPVAPAVVPALPAPIAPVAAPCVAPAAKPLAKAPVKKIVAKKVISPVKQD